MAAFLKGRNFKNDEVMRGVIRLKTKGVDRYQIEMLAERLENW